MATLQITQNFFETLTHVYCPGLWLLVKQVKRNGCGSSMAAMNSCLLLKLFLPRAHATTSPLQRCHPGQRLSSRDGYPHICPPHDRKPVQQPRNKMICIFRIVYSITQLCNWHQREIKVLPRHNSYLNYLGTEFYDTWKRLSSREVCYEYIYIQGKKKKTITQF